MDYYERIYGRDNPPGDAHGWIQWKGTQPCIDINCQCGELSHLDAEYFAYYVQCPYCGAKYAMGQNIKLIPLTEEDLTCYREQHRGEEPHFFKPDRSDFVEVFDPQGQSLP